MTNRLLFERDVIKAVDKHTTDDEKLDNDISCILEEVKSPIFIGSREGLNSLNTELENKPVEKEKRIQLYENEDIVLERRGNKYYLSLYDKDGKFQREVTIAVKDDYKVSMCNGM